MPRNWDQYVQLKQMLVAKAKESGLSIVFLSKHYLEQDKDLDRCPFCAFESKQNLNAAKLLLCKKR